VSAWTPAFEAETCALVDQILASADQAAWRALMVRVAPSLETWARGNRLLKRCRLAGDDDARAVMVTVFERLAANDFENLRRFVARSEPPASAPDLVEEVLRLGKLDDDADTAPAAAAATDASRDTPLRAWLLRLVDFTARDHVRRRLGWGARDGLSKRDVQSDAAPLEAADEPATRPPLTDRITVAKLIDEIVAYIATFPAPMATALRLWLDDHDPVEIAARLDLSDPARAKALIRAGQARLRERFHGRSPVLFA
jgi:DNA-directed RNA polymerase specialized sigma24 family protein